jgi:hypothetical protein
VLLREIRLGPIQNAAIDIGAVSARTTPFVFTIAGGSLQVSLRVTRVMAHQPSQVTIVLVDDCGDWHTFVGGGTGIAVAPPVATATPVPIVPGQPYGSIPISLTVFGSSQYPPGSRPRAQIITRANAVCGLSVTWPDGRTDTLSGQTADARGSCLFRPLVPIGMRSGTATATGTARDIFGFNIQQATFAVGGDLSQIPPGDNITSVDALIRSDDSSAQAGDDNMDNVDDNDNRTENENPEGSD